MWQPTHVKVTVKQAHGLIAKGKNGTNDAFVVIGIGKEKFQTSIKEKSPPNVEWREECELEIPSQGNKATVQLTAYHHNALGLDEFLGQTTLPLSDFDIYEKPKYRWYRLKGKPDKDKKKGEKERGELEVMVNFTVNSEAFGASKKEKHKSSLSSIKHLGGSLLSIGSKEKQGLKNFAKSVSSKMDKIAKPKRRKSKNPSDSSSFTNDLGASQQYFGEADPGVISDDDDFRFEDDVKINTRTSSPMSTMSRGSSLVQEQVIDAAEADYEVGSYDDRDHDFGLNFGVSPSQNIPRIVDETRETLSPHDTFYPAYSGKVTSFSDPKPSITMINTPPSCVSQTIIEEESSLEKDEDLVPHVTKESKLNRDQSDSLVKASNSGGPFESTPQATGDNPFEEDICVNASTELNAEDFPVMTSKIKNSSSSTVPVASIVTNTVYSNKETENEMSTSNLNTSFDRGIAAEKPDSSKDGNDYSFLHDSSLKEDQDSAISVGNDQESVSSSDQTSVNTSSALSPLSKNKLKMILEQKPKMKKFRKSSSEFDLLLRKSDRNKEVKADFIRDNSKSTERKVQEIGRSSLRSDKRASAPVDMLVQEQQPTVIDEWGRKLYGRLGMTGSMENMSRSESRSSLNTSRESSVHDIPKDDSFTRLPEVKALTLDRSLKEIDEESKKQKKKSKNGFKSRFFSSKLETSREKINEGRFVEGGNDRLPNIPSRSSKLPQEIHDKFAGKSREDLLELILNLQADLENQVKHSTELEEYIDNLLLRVMEATPHILHAPVHHSVGIPKYNFD